MRKFPSHYADTKEWEDHFGGSVKIPDLCPLLAEAISALEAHCARIAVLEAVRDVDHKQIDANVALMKRAAAFVRRAEAERHAMQEDAERYRFIRKSYLRKRVPNLDSEDSVEISFEGSDDHIYAAVDAARAILRQSTSG